MVHIFTVVFVQTKYPHTDPDKLCDDSADDCLFLKTEPQNFVTRKASLSSMMAWWSRYESYYDSRLQSKGLLVRVARSWTILSLELLNLVCKRMVQQLVYYSSSCCSCWHCTTIRSVCVTRVHMNSPLSYQYCGLSNDYDAYADIKFCVRTLGRGDEALRARVAMHVTIKF